MTGLLLKYFTVFGFCTLKFIAGPLMGAAMGFTIIETMTITILGMMTSVLVFSFFGRVIREKVWLKIWRSPKKFSRNNRRFIKIWKRYGIFGVSFLTPVIFSPIGGTLLVSIVTGGKKRKKIFLYMLFSALFWAIVFTYGVYFLHWNI